MHLLKGCHVLTYIYISSSEKAYGNGTSQARRGIHTRVSAKVKIVLMFKMLKIIVLLRNKYVGT